MFGIPKPAKPFVSPALAEILLHKPHRLNVPQNHFAEVDRIPRGVVGMGIIPQGAVHQPAVIGAVPPELHAVRRDRQHSLSLRAPLIQVGNTSALIVHVQNQRAGFRVLRHREVRRDVIPPRVLLGEADFHGINRKHGIGRGHLSDFHQLGRDPLQFCQLGVPEGIKVVGFCFRFLKFLNLNARAALEVVHAAQRVAVLVACNDLQIYKPRNVKLGCQREYAGFAVRKALLGLSAVVRLQDIFEFRAGCQFAVGAEADREFYFLARLVGDRIFVGCSRKIFLRGIALFNIHLG